MIEDRVYRWIERPADERRRLGELRSHLRFVLVASVAPAVVIYGVAMGIGLAWGRFVG